MIRQPLLAEARSPSDRRPAGRCAGLTFRRLLPSRPGAGWSYGWLHVLPPGHSRRACRPRAGVLAQAGEVDRGVKITVQDRAAVVTLVLPVGQGELGFHRAAGRAGLRAGVPPVRGHELAAVPGGLVAELAAHPAGAASAMARFSPRPPRPAPGLRRDMPATFRSSTTITWCRWASRGGGLVQHVAAQVRGAGVDPPDPRRGPRPPLRPVPPRRRSGPSCRAALRCTARSRAWALASALAPVPAPPRCRRARRPPADPAPRGPHRPPDAPGRCQHAPGGPAHARLPR